MNEIPLFFNQSDESFFNLVYYGCIKDLTCDNDYVKVEESVILERIEKNHFLKEIKPYSIEFLNKSFREEKLSLTEFTRRALKKEVFLDEGDFVVSCDFAYSFSCHPATAFLFFTSRHDIYSLAGVGWTDRQAKVLINEEENKISIVKDIKLPYFEGLFLDEEVSKLCNLEKYLKEQLNKDIIYGYIERLLQKYNEEEVNNFNNMLVEKVMNYIRGRRKEIEREERVLSELENFHLKILF